MALYFKMSTSILFCLLFSFVNGFLLDTNKGQQTSTNQGYLTLSEFFDEKTKLQDRVTDLRDDMDKKLTLMTLQLQQMISSSQGVAVKYCQNETKRLEHLEQKYQKLSENYTKFRSEKFQDLDQKFNDLLKNYSSLDATKLNFEQKYNEVLDNNTKLDEKVKVLTEEYALQKIELSLLRNKTFENNKEIGNLNSLKNIQQLNDLNALEKKVQSIASHTSSLLSHERARNEDFRALYNLTVHSDNRITELNTNWEIKQNLTLNKVRDSEVSQNKTLSIKVTELKGNLKDLDKKIKNSESGQNQTLDIKIVELQKSLNLSLTQVRGLIDKNSERVALTACNSDGATRPSGYVWKFDDIRTHTGINNLSSFKSTGKFTCDSDGLYIVSAWVMSHISGSQFFINKNGNVVARTYITNSSDDDYYTGTAVVAVEIAVNDTVWVSPGISMDAYGGYSCLTIVKIK